MNEKEMEREDERQTDTELWPTRTPKTHTHKNDLKQTMMDYNVSDFTN